MNRSRHYYKHVWLVLVAMVVLFSAEAAACSSGPPSSYCGKFRNDKVVFVGTAVEKSVSDGRDMYRFSVEEVLKGISSETHEVTVDPGIYGLCFGGFEIGKQYMMGSRSPGIRAQSPAALINVVADEAVPMESASEELRNARNRKANPPPTELLGTVLNGREYYFPPLPGALVEITGPKGKTTLSVKKDGTFMVQHPTPGEYVIRAKKSGFESEDPWELDLIEGGCLDISINMRAHAAVSGRVIHEDGSPAPGVNVELRFVDRRFYLYESNETDSNGMFKIDDLPSAEFYVGVGIMWTPDADDHIVPTYWPNSRAPGKSNIVRLSPNKEESGLVIVLGPPAPERRIKVTVTGLDGHPVSKAGVMFLADGCWRELDDETNEKGEVTIALLSGVRYHLMATARGAPTSSDRNQQSVPKRLYSKNVVTDAFSPQDYILVLDGTIDEQNALSRFYKPEAN